MLYMFINLVYCYAIPWDPDGTLNLQYAPLFFGNSTRAQQAWAVLIAFSAVGSMISVTYTCVRVKQTIAWSNILPWSPFWRTSAPVRSEKPQGGIELQRLISRDLERDEVRNELVLRTGAPQGGIALHWVSCVFFVAVSAAIDSITEAISFSGLLLTYGHAIVGVFLGFLFPRVAKVQDTLPRERGWDAQEPPWWLRPRIMQWGLGLLYATGSLVILVLTAIGPYINTDGSARKVKGWYYPMIMFSFLGLSIIYYTIFLASGKYSAVQAAGVKRLKKQHGKDDAEILICQCDFCRQFDSNPHRHARDGYQDFFEFHFPEKDGGRNPLYWLFGGSKEKHYPDIRLDEILPGLWDRLKRLG